ncbi:MAG: DinB family protein [Ignavibacteriales bacterium]|nr:DinB family protein [Ignavibacteriales bacterium]
MTLQNYLAYFDEMLKPTESLFRLVPAGNIDWKPTENSFSLGQQMAHMAGALKVYGHGMATGDWGFKSMRERFVKNRHTPSATIDEAVKALHENHAEFKRLVGSLTEEEFNVGEIETPQFGGKVPRWRIGMLAVEHHINHKAEFFMCLKLLGVRVNTGHLYRG